MAKKEKITVQGTETAVITAKENDYNCIFFKKKKTYICKKNGIKNIYRHFNCWRFFR